MKSVPLPFFIIIGLFEIAYSFFLLVVRPFESSFTNFRLVVISLALIATDVVMCIYLYQSMQGSYNLMYEKLVIFLVLSVLGMGVLFAFLEHLQAWRR